VKPSLAACLVILGTSALAGCGAAPGDRVARDLSTARKESTPDKLVARGRAFAGVGDLTRAEQYLAAAIESGAPVDRVMPELLRVCIAAGHERAAIDYATPHLHRHPSDVRLRFVVAELRAVTGDAAGARTDLELVVAGQPDAPAPHYAFARLLRDQLGDPLGADREFRAYLRVAPTGEHAEEARSNLLRRVVVRGPGAKAKATASIVAAEVTP
jgi:Flp pilus assembly protein TadD